MMLDRVLLCAAEVDLLPVSALATCRGMRDAAHVLFEEQYKRDCALLQPLILHLEARHAALLRPVRMS